MFDSNPEKGIEKNGDDWHGLKEDAEHSKVVVLVLVAGQLACVRDYNTDAHVVNQATGEHTPHIRIFIPIKVQ